MLRKIKDKWRRFLLEKRRISIAPDVSIYSLENILFSQDILIADQTLINARGGLRIGKNVMIGPRVMILTTDHDLETRKSKYMPIVIEDNVWIGAGAIILPGVRIKHGSVIGAGTIIAKDCNENTLYLGVAGKPYKSISVDENNSYFTQSKWLKQ